jgi:nucleoside-specific outer membrane channel protein Tsx
MTQPDFRALCAELLLALETEGYTHWTINPDEDPLCERARTALATAPPEPPTDEELLALEKKLWHEYKTISYQGDEFMYDDGFRYALRDYRAALERWG